MIMLKSFNFSLNRIQMHEYERYLNEMEIFGTYYEKNKKKLNYNIIGQTEKQFHIRYIN